MALSRRRLLVGAALGGGLVVAWALRDPAAPLPLPAAPGEAVFDSWIRIGADGVVSVSVPQLEMGQGVATLFARIVAAELGADWRALSVTFPPVSAPYPNAPLAAHWAGLWLPLAHAPLADTSALARRWAIHTRFNATADGTSLAAYEAPLRQAAACARDMLVRAAARQWGVAPEQCAVKDSAITHAGRRLHFAQVAGDAAKLTPPDPVPLLPAPVAENPATHPPGSAIPFARLDGPAKVSGGWMFAGDVRLPGMVYAAIRHAPVGRTARLGGHDAGAAKGIDGFVRLVEGPDWLAAVAGTTWAAEQALAAVAPRFAVDHPVSADHIEGVLDGALKQAQGKGAQPIATLGDAAALLSPKAPYAARYDAAPALAAPLETACAVARMRDGLCEVWLAAQAPEAARRAIADALGMALDHVVLYPMGAGGSFDARLECPHGVEAALIAKACGKPVMLTYTRWQEAVTAIHRAPMAAQVEARVDQDGGIAAWRLRVAMPSSAREFGARLIDGATRHAAMADHQTHRDPLAMEGFTPPYAMPAMAIEHAPVAVGIPTGRLRGQGYALGAFITESFIDEVAVAQHREPLSYRVGMLGGDPRLVACLQKVSALANWNGGQDGSGQGVACVRIGGACIAAVVTARQGASGVAVERIVAVADIGRIIHVDIARQQIEGGLIHGIALALGSAPVWHRGLPMGARLGQMNLPILANCPQVEVDLIASNADPADPGEVGVAVAAPAIANALFSATGVRLRRLPLGAEE